MNRVWKFIDRKPGGHDSPDLAVPPQPVPRFAIIATVPNGSFTAITRRFEDGDAAHCRLRPEGTCCAVQDICAIIVSGVVAPKDAPLFSSIGIPRAKRQ
jgi:hypothetical protein